MVNLIVSYVESWWRTLIWQQVTQQNYTLYCSKTLSLGPCKSTYLGLLARWTAKKPLFRNHMKREKCAFPKNYVNWTKDDWKNIMWSDELTFQCISRSRTVRHHASVDHYHSPLHCQYCAAPQISDALGLFQWLGRLRRVVLFCTRMLQWPLTTTSPFWMITCWISILSMVAPLL